MPRLTHSILALLLILVLLFPAAFPCPARAAPSMRQSQVFWSFDLRRDPDLTPHSNVFLHVRGKRILILRDADSAFNVMARTSYPDHDVPSQAISACTSWFAGQGEDLYVIRRRHTLIVYRRAVDEEAATLPYKRLKVIPLR